MRKFRICFFVLFVALTILVQSALAAGTSDTSSSTGSQNLGSVWIVKEYGSMGNYDGVWTRRTGTDTFDASWSGDGSATDVIDFVSLKGDQITLHRRGNNGYYTGTISPSGKTITGKGSWYSSGETWTVSITSGTVATTTTAAASASLIQSASVWNEKEYIGTDSSHATSTVYSGQWIRRPGTNTFDATWWPSDSDVIVLTSIVGNKITMHRNTNNGDYTGTISSDGKSIRGIYSPIGRDWTETWEVSLPDGTAATATTAVVTTRVTTISTISGTAQGPDLIVTAIGGPVTAQPGEKITVTDTIRNQGGSEMKNVYTYYYLNTNNQESRLGTMLPGEQHTVSVLSAGAEDTGSVAVTVPADIKPGTYYLRVNVYAKPQDSLKEDIDPSNNYLYATSSVRVTESGTGQSASGSQTPLTGGVRQTTTTGTPSQSGKYTSLDALAALQMSVGKRTQDLSYDLINDGKVDSKDASEILRLAVNQ